MFLVIIALWSTGAIPLALVDQESVPDIYSSGSPGVGGGGGPFVGGNVKLRIGEYGPQISLQARTR
jgi:hypothetical protein